MLGKRTRKEDNESPTNKRQKIEKKLPDEIRSRIVELKRQYDGQNTTNFKDKLCVAHKKRYLNQLHETLDLPTQLAEKHIMAILAENYKQFKGSFLFYSALPKDAFTQLFCDIAIWLQDVTKEPALTILLPEIETESIYGEIYDDLTEKDIGSIFKTHILSQCGKYLLPVNLLLNIPIDQDSNQSIFNPYYSFKNDENGAILNHNELDRLYDHSAITRALKDAKESFHQFTEQDNSLYGQLNLLTKALYLNSIEFMGTEYDAASGAYSAIIRFRDYYQKLSEEQKQKINSPLRMEIEKLLDLSSNPQMNRNAEYNAETCIASRREELVKEIRKNPEILMEICLNEENHKEAIKEQKEIYESNQTLLAQQLAKNYCGVDNLPLTMATLKSLGITPEVASEDEFTALMTLRTDEFETLLYNFPQLANQIVKLFTSIESFVLFIINTNQEHLRILLPELQDFLIQEKCLCNIADIKACLIPLEGEKLETVCRGLLLKNNELTVVRSAENFNDVLEHLDTEQRTIIYQVFKEHFHSIIKTADDYFDIVVFLSEQQRAEVYQTLKDQLLSMINTADDFFYILLNLSDDQRDSVYVKNKERLPQLIETAKEFATVLDVLNPAQRNEVWLMLKEQLTKKINNVEDLQHALYYCTPEQCDDICQKIKKRLPQIIDSAANFRSVVKELNADQRNIVYSTYKTELPAIIHTAEDLFCILENLNAKQCFEVCQSITKKLSKIIDTAWNFASIIRYLNDEQRTVFCNVFKEHLPNIMKTPEDVSYVFILLGLNQFNILSSILTKSLPGILRTSQDLQKVIQNVDNEQRTMLFQVVETWLPEIIKTSSEAARILKNLSVKQCEIFCRASSDNLSAIIRNPEDFWNILMFLNEEQRGIVFETFKNRLPEIINNALDCAYVLISLNEKQCSDICNKILDKSLSILPNCEEAMNLFKLLNPCQRTIFYEAFKVRLFQIIENSRDFNDIIQYLSSEQIADIVVNMRSSIHELIGNEEALYSFLSKYHIPLTMLALSTDNQPLAVASDNTFYTPHYTNHLEVDIVSLNLDQGDNTSPREANKRQM